MSLFSFARGRAADLPLHGLVERRSEQLEAYRPSAGRTFLGEPLNHVLSEYHKIPRDHAISPFVSALIGPVYLIRAVEKAFLGFFSSRVPN